MNDAKPILGEDTIFGRLYYQDADYDALRAELAELLDRLDVMTQCADNYSRMFEESAEECEHLKACQENAMLHMTGLVAERDTLRQQLAERDATIARLEAGIPRIQEQSHRMRQQRDRLAGLLQKARWYVASARYSDNDEGDFAARRQEEALSEIDAALAEVNK